MATAPSSATSAFTQLDMDFNEYCRRGDGKRLMQLLFQGANVNCRDEHYGWTPLHNAAREGFIDIMKVLIHKGAEVNARDSMGQTALHRAAQRGHKKAVNFLLFAGADAVIKDNLDQNAADVAKSERQDEVYLLLLKAVHKREKELLEERRKAEKLEEKLKKKEKKQLEKQEKQEKRTGGSSLGFYRGMRKNRSLSMDDGLQHSSDQSVISSPATPTNSTHTSNGYASKSAGSVNDLGGIDKEKKRRSFGHEYPATSHSSEEEEENRHSVATLPAMYSSGSLPKMAKSVSVEERGELWLGYINGEIEQL